MTTRDRLARLSAIRIRPDEIEAKTRRIYRAVLDRSAHLRTGNFGAIGVDDLEFLFDRYDEEFFGGLLRSMLEEDHAWPFEFRLSSRLTRAGGKTTHRRVRKKAGLLSVVRSEYEIAISTLLLFQTFREIDRPVVVVGLHCRDRLEALQRIFEHELLHLAEFLAMGRSSCSAEPFRGLSVAIFGHRAWVHDLVTPREIAEKSHAIRIGDRVAFDHEGITRSGRVNRITKRATVLVEDPAGERFTDGRRYLRFYVPLGRLRKEP